MPTGRRCATTEIAARNDALNFFDLRQHPVFFLSFGKAFPRTVAAYASHQESPSLADQAKRLVSPRSVIAKGTGSALRRADVSVLP
jgi:hypothetical protein